MYYCSDTYCFEKGNSDSDNFYLVIVTVDLNNFRVESKCTEREASTKGTPGRQKKRRMSRESGLRWLKWPVFQ